MKRVLCILIVALTSVGCIKIQSDHIKQEAKVNGWRALLTQEEQPNWQLTPWRPNAAQWSLFDGVYQGACAAGWVGHADVFEDFILECDFLCVGIGGGAIVFRGNREEKRTWESGYSLGIGPTEDKKRSCISFAVLPKGFADRRLSFESGKWQSIRAEVRGAQITVTLNGNETIQVSDTQKQFVRGQICLEDRPCQKGDRCDGKGHVKYRNLRVRPL